MKGFVSKQTVVLLHQWGTGNNKITKHAYAGKGEIITRGNIITSIMQLVWYKILVLISIALKMSARPLLFNLPLVIKRLVFMRKLNKIFIDSKEDAV